MINFGVSSLYITFNIKQHLGEAWKIFIMELKLENNSYTSYTSLDYATQTSWSGWVNKLEWMGKSVNIIDIMTILKKQFL